MIMIETFARLREGDNMEDMTNSDVYQYYQSLFKLNNNPCFILNMMVNLFYVMKQH